MKIPNICLEILPLLVRQILIFNGGFKEECVGGIPFAFASGIDLAILSED